MTANADVRAGLSRARLDRVVAEKLAALSVPEVLPPLSMAEQVVRAHDAAHTHTLEAHEVITAELVACTLGARRRPELRVDPAGRLWHQVRTMVAGLQRVFRVCA